jgi:type IV secretory pathway VirB2 component (pilin)
MQASTLNKHAVLTIALLVVSEPSFANRLEQAAQSATSTATTVARACSVVALMIGAIAMQFGAAEMGKRIALGGIIGCVLAFGGPMIASAIQDLVQ